MSRVVPMAATSVPTSYTRIPTRDSNRALSKNKILGFVEKEQGEVVGRQMAEQINIEEEFSSLLFLLPLPSPSKCMGLSAAGLKVLAWGLAT